MTVRVRFAPSPTGFPHIGNIRTALFNWLFAKHNNGKFILRIEDTDQARKVEGSVEAIQEGLKWLGLDWDEGPIFQSSRLDIYKMIAEQMIKEGNAYVCNCSSITLKLVKEYQEANKLPIGYNKFCRELNLPVETPNSVIRFKVPKSDMPIKFHDEVCGDIQFKTNLLDDFVMLKSDGFPTYHLANICDDHAMSVTHVLRADEWLSSTPKHILMYNAMRWKPPIFAHMPLILGPDKSKLSKRHGATGLLDYRELGYLPDTIINFLSLLGWSLDDKTTLMDKDTIIKNFSLERISKSPAVFDVKKLDWMNGQYIRKMSDGEFVNYSGNFIQNIKQEMNDPQLYSKAILSIKDNIQKFSDIKIKTSLYFSDPTYSSEMVKELQLLGKDNLHDIIAFIIVCLKYPFISIDNIENVIKEKAISYQIPHKDIFMIFRIALTGNTFSPPFKDMIKILGSETCIRRLQKCYRF